MDMDKNFKTDMERTKVWSKFGCLAWFIILILGPIIFFIGFVVYEMHFKETSLLVSHSPNGTNTIEVVEKGEPAFFGPSSVRIKSGWEHIERSVSNDGKKLQESNAAVRWENDHEATITIYGEEQSPEVIRFNAEESPPFVVEESD